jgi:hypothetical protein
MYFDMFYILWPAGQIGSMEFEIKYLRHYATSQKVIFETQLGKWLLSVYLILLAALGPGVYSVSNRNDYQRQK